MSVARNLIENTNRCSPSLGGRGGLGMGLVAVFLVLLASFPVSSPKPANGVETAKEANFFLFVFLLKVCHMNVPLYFIGNVVLFVTWNIIFCRSSKCAVSIPYHPRFHSHVVSFPCKPLLSLFRQVQELLGSSGSDSPVPENSSYFTPQAPTHFLCPNPTHY